MRLVTWALNALRSSSRRSCQKPRLIISTMPNDHEQVEADPARGVQEPVHAPAVTVAPPVPISGARPVRSATWSCRTSTSPHAEKIEWMIETDGFAVEPVLPDATSDPPRPAYTYTIGFPDHASFPDVVVFGLTPVAASGLLGLVAELCLGGTEIPLDVELVGLLDNELRCRFAHVDLDEWAPLFATARGLVPRRAVRGGPADLSRPQRLPALRGRVRAADALRPAGDRDRLRPVAALLLRSAPHYEWPGVQARQPG